MELSAAAIRKELDTYERLTPEEVDALYPNAFAAFKKKVGEYYSFLGGYSTPEAQKAFQTDYALWRFYLSPGAGILVAMAVGESGNGINSYWFDDNDGVWSVIHL